MFLVPFSLTLSHALGFCKQRSDQLCPTEQPVVVCPHPHPAAARPAGQIPGLRFRFGSTSLRAEENAPHQICLHSHKTRGLMSSTYTLSDVNHPLVPRLSAKALACLPRAGVRWHTHPPGRPRLQHPLSFLSQPGSCKEGLAQSPPALPWAPGQAARLQGRLFDPSVLLLATAKERR